MFNQKNKKKYYYDYPEDTFNYSLKNLTYFPNSILSFTYLVELNLSNNKIKQIPNEISKLKSLTFLYLNKNLLTNLPMDIINLKKLVLLDLSNNPIDYNLMHPLIIKFLRTLQSGKKLYNYELKKIIQYPSINQQVQTNKILHLTQCIEAIDKNINIKTKKSIKNIVLNNQFNYLDVTSYVDNCTCIKLSVKLILQQLIQKYGCEMYCVIKRKYKQVVYYDYLDEKYITCNVKLPDNYIINVIVTICTILDYFFNFVNSSKYKKLLYNLFNNELEKVDVNKVSLDQLVFLIINLLDYFDEHVVLFKK